MGTIKNNQNNYNRSSFSTAKVNKVRSFSEYAFQQAGLNRGNANSLTTNLKLIKDGHLVDDTYDEEDHQNKKKVIFTLISEKKENKNNLDGEKRKISEVDIVSSNQKIKDFKDEIHQTEIDLEKGRLDTGYQSIRYYTYIILVSLLSVYLILFYASAIYASFFRNAISIINNAGDDIALYLDSIFDIKGIFTPSYSLVIVYLGAFLFFAIGLIPHTLQGKYKKLRASLAIFGALVVDSLLAYKIDLGIHNLKEMAGIADENWYFLTSINFYLVLVFGFLAYLVWGYMYELMINEKIKKNANMSANLIINNLKSEIKEQKKLIKELNTKVIDIESKITNLISAIEQLKINLEKSKLNPDLLSQSLTSFYKGWLQYLNSSTDMGDNKIECKEAYNDFLKTNFNTEPSLN